VADYLRRFRAMRESEIAAAKRRLSAEGGS
jgi:hypothetical protein